MRTSARRPTRCSPSDAEFATAVRQWERRLGELNVHGRAGRAARAGVGQDHGLDRRHEPGRADAAAGRRRPPGRRGARSERRDHRSDPAHAALARPHGDDRRARGLDRRHRGRTRIPPRHAAGRLAPEAAGGRARGREAGRGRARGGARGAGGAAGAVRRGVPEGRAVAGVRDVGRHRQAHRHGAPGRGRAAGRQVLSIVDRDRSQARRRARSACSGTTTSRCGRRWRTTTRR